MLYKTMAGAILAKHKKEQKGSKIPVAVVRTLGSRFYRLEPDTTTMRIVRAKTAPKLYGRKSKRAA